ncbi:MAG: hypothetical protein QOH61_120, partial [Chloroflexota bacterium]|nr:hypothetical protein [Chloroflexota bacterium]
MTDELDALAVEYHDFQRRMAPTYAHLEGDYRFAETFEDVSRAAEDRRIQDDRDFARRATAIDERQLGTQDRITREMIAWSASV